VTRGVGGDACFLACGARHFGCQARLFAVGARGLGRLSQPLALLSNCFERLATMITDLTPFLREPPALFRLALGGLRARAVFRCRTGYVAPPRFV
jgi:hypothetical protein